MWLFKSRGLIFILLLLGTGLFAPPPPPILSAGFQPLQLISPEGRQQIYRTEIVRTPAARKRGLQHRHVMPSDTAMLFIWPDKSVRQFWMRNTFISLDLLFFDEAGILLHSVSDTTPLSPKIISSIFPVRYVLELRAGEIARHGFLTGTRLILPAALAK